MQQFIGDCDRKVSVNKRRLEETQDAESLGPEALAVHELNEQIGIKLAEAEELGNNIFGPHIYINRIHSNHSFRSVSHWSVR